MIFFEVGVAGVVEVAGHVDEDDGGIFLFERGHGVEIFFNALACVVGAAAAPRPDDDVDVFVVRQVLARAVGPGRIAAMAEVAGHGTVVQVERAVLAAVVPREGACRVLGEAEAAVVGELDKAGHAGGQLAAVRGVAVGDVERVFGGVNLREGEFGDVGVGMVEDHVGLLGRGFDVGRIVGSLLGGGRVGFVFGGDVVGAAERGEEGQRQRDEDVYAEVLHRVLLCDFGSAYFIRRARRPPQKLAATRARWYNSAHRRDAEDAEDFQGNIWKHELTRIYFL